VVVWALGIALPDGKRIFPKDFQAKADSPSRPPAISPEVLTIGEDAKCLACNMLAGSTGLEPAASGVTGRCQRSHNAADPGKSGSAVPHRAGGCHSWTRVSENLASSCKRITGSDRQRFAGPAEGYATPDQAARGFDRSRRASRSRSGPAIRESRIAYSFSAPSILLRLRSNVPSGR
jgi:hypothetical protein